MSLFSRRDKWFWISIFTWLILCVTFIYRYYIKVQAGPVNEEILLARAEAKNLESFFQVFGESIDSLAHVPSIESGSAASAQVLDTFMDQWRESSIVSGILLTNSDGTVIFHSDINKKTEIGASLADRDYFLWAKNSPKKGGYLVGNPVISRLGGSKGEIIAPVASPVYSNGNFSGMVVASVKLKPLINKYLKMIKASNVDETYVVDQRGVVVFSDSHKEAFGESIYILIDQELMDIVESNKDGSLKVSEKVIVYSPIHLTNQDWMLITFTK